MGLILLLVLLALVLGGVGFSLHFLWIIAAVAIILAVVGFAARGGWGGGPGWW